MPGAPTAPERCHSVMSLRLPTASIIAYLSVCEALKLRSLPFTHPIYVASRYFQSNPPSLCDSFNTNQRLSERERERAFIQEGLGSTLGLRFSVRNTNASSSIRGNPLVHLIWASLFSVSRNTDTSIVRAATFNPFGPSFMLYTVFNTSISHAGS